MTFSKKKFLIVSLESLSGDLAWRLSREGNEVKCHIRSKSDADVYDGFVEKVDDWKKWVDWADVVVFDDIEFGEIAEKLRKEGKKVVGGSPYTDRLEIDREFGQSELKKHGVSVLPNWHFTNYDEAIQFIKEKPGRYVFKPSGNNLSESKGLLFLGEEEDGRDLLAVLEQNKNIWKKSTTEFLLQKYISGIEVAVGAYFNGTDFLHPINVNFEHKRVFPGDVGPFAGEMGTLMYWSEPNKLFEETLAKMLPALKESGYVGYIDVNCMVNGRGIYPLEFTARFGYPTLQIHLEAITMPIGEWLFRMANKENFEMKIKKGFQVGVRILVPTYFCNTTDPILHPMYKDMAVTFKNPDNLDGLHIEDVKNDNGVWRLAGTSGVVMVVTGCGQTVEEARKMAYSRIKNIIIPNMFYRTDIGQSWFVECDRLHTWGYLR